ncbi:hypothetical protein ES332_A01G039600v1 [Gossypium tomentosum]|uniref:Enoyl-CoA hydratase n=1 Tax=Gossypium tomentosum TaxID=34277 RepID=A0A5D2RPC2_GOSTO|nr:hypothetical protein ES332_A01G039600v1 [Gossypium tomentosum]
MSDSSSENLILVSREPDGIATVTINRPASLNSLSQLMITDLARAFKDLGRDESVRVIILSGSGRAFCSGLDLTAAEQVFKGGMKDKEYDPVFQMEQCPKPIIGAINGVAVTAGFEIALAFTTRLTLILLFGIVPSWGLSQKLPRIIGPNKAREVSLTAMPFTSEEAQKLGFVNYVVEGTELLKKAREIARVVAHNNHDIVIRYKSLINDGFKLDLHQALALEKERAYKYYDKMTTEVIHSCSVFSALSSYLRSGMGYE